MKWTNRFFCAAATLGLMTTAAGASGPAQMVKDIMAGQVTSDSDASEFAERNGVVYYQGYHPSTGAELWRTDGTAAGTWMVKDLLDGQDGGAPTKLKVWNGYVYFMAQLGGNAQSLWRTDGTEQGTVDLMKNTGYAGIDNYYISPTGKFLVEAGALIITDFTAGGTVKLTDLNVNLSRAVLFLGDAGLYTLFTIKDDANGWKLWKTDGTPEGTGVIPSVQDGSGTKFAGSTQLGEHVFFLATGGLWKSDGTQAGTYLIKSLGPVLSGHFIPMVPVQGTFYFKAYEGIWKSDGTAEGTALISPGGDGSNSHSLTAAGGLLYYIAGVNNGTPHSHSPEVWRSDGTAAGTFPITNFNTPGDTQPQNMTAVGNRLFFRERTNGDLYVTDGTVTGTQLVKEFERVVSASFDDWPVGALGNSAVFTAEGGTGRDLWVSDGTLAGTRLVYEPLTGMHSKPMHLVSVGDKWFFHAEDGVHGREPWVSDGTAEGSFMLKDIWTGTEGSMAEYTAFTAMNGRVYFSAYSEVSGRELWESDGTPAGTRLVKDIEPGAGYSSPTGIKSANGLLFFSAYTTVHGAEMWVSDGTDAGTTIIVEISAYRFSQPEILAIMNDEVYFKVPNYDATNGAWAVSNNLYKSDGTAAGTTLLAELEYYQSEPILISSAIVNGNLIFTNRTSSAGLELWKTDGTILGTKMVKDILPGELHSAPRYFLAAGDSVYFYAFNGSGTGLWKTDGSEAGTTRVPLPGDGWYLPRPYAEFQEKLIFGDDNKGLWETDGTEGGTSMIHPVDAAEVEVIDIQSMVFSGNNGGSGWELWASNGTAVRTKMMQDIYPGGSSAPADFAVGNDGRVLFTAEDAEHGRELWVLDSDDLWPAAALGWELYE